MVHAVCVSKKTARSLFSVEDNEREGRVTTWRSCDHDIRAAIHLAWALSAKDHGQMMATQMFEDKGKQCSPAVFAHLRRAQRSTTLNAYVTAACGKIENISIGSRITWERKYDASVRKLCGTSSATKIRITRNTTSLWQICSIRSDCYTDLRRYTSERGGHYRSLAFFEHSYLSWNL